MTGAADYAEKMTNWKDIQAPGDADNDFAQLISRQSITLSLFSITVMTPKY